MFRTLKIWQKLALVAILMAVPLAILIVLFVNSRNEQIDAARAELRALDYEGSLRRLAEALPKHRDVMQAVLTGDVAKGVIAEAATRKVDEAIADVSRFDEAQGAVLATSDKWRALKARWFDLKEQSKTLTVRDSFTRHTQLVNDVIEHMRFLADRGGLTTDPQLDSYYLWDLMISGAMNGAQYASDLRGTAVAVGGKGLATVDEAAQLLVLSRQFHFTGAIVDRDSLSMLRYNPVLKSTLGDSLASASEAAAKLNQVSQTELASSLAKFDGKAFAEAGAQAAAVHYQLFDPLAKGHG